MSAAFSRSVSVLVLLALGGCAPTFRNHGYAPPEEDLARVQVGVDDRTTTLAKLGQPSTFGALDAESWYYTESKVEHYTYHAPKVVDRTVVAVSFAEDGTVSDVSRFGIDQGRIINLETRTTPTYGRRLTILQQAFGNFGQINPATLLGE